MVLLMAGLVNFKMPRCLKRRVVGLTCLLFVSVGLFAATADKHQYPAQDDAIELWHALSTDPMHFNNYLHSLELKRSHLINAVWFGADDLPTILNYTVASGLEVPDALIVPVDQLYQRHGASFATLPQVWLERYLIDSDLFYDTSGNPIAVDLEGGYANFLVLYYRKSLVPTLISDWTELETLSTTMGKPVVAFPATVPYWFTPFLHASGFHLATNVDEKVAAVLQALQAYKALFDEGVIDPRCLSDQNCIASDFVEGDVPFAIEGNWAYSQLKERMGEDLGVVVLPQLHGRAFRGVRVPFVLTTLNALSPGQADQLKSLLDGLLSIKSLSSDGLSGEMTEKQLLAKDLFVQLSARSTFSYKPEYQIEVVWNAMRPVLAAYLTGDLSDESVRTILVARLRGES